MSKPRDEGPSPPFSIAPKSFPEGPLVTVTVLGHPSRNLTHHWLTNNTLGTRQGEVKWAEVVILPGR